MFCYEILIVELSISGGLKGVKVECVCFGYFLLCVIRRPMILIKLIVYTLKQHYEFCGDPVKVESRNKIWKSTVH